MNDDILDFLFGDLTDEGSDKPNSIVDSSDIFNVLNEDSAIRKQDLSFIVSTSTNPDNSVFSEFIEPDIFEE